MQSYKKHWMLTFLCLFSQWVGANSLLDLNDDQFKRLLGRGIPNECIQYYLGDMTPLTHSVEDLKIIDVPGQAARQASQQEKDMTLNQLLETLELRCYQDVKRAIVTNNFYKDMPLDLYADDFSDRRVLDRYLNLVGLQ